MVVKACHGEDPFVNNDTHPELDPIDDRWCKASVNLEPDDYLRIYFLSVNKSISVHGVFLLADNANFFTARGAKSWMIKKS